MFQCLPTPFSFYSQHGIKLECHCEHDRTELPAWENIKLLVIVINNFYSVTLKERKNFLEKCERMSMRYYRMLVDMLVLLTNMLVVCCMMQNVTISNCNILYHRVTPTH